MSCLKNSYNETSILNIKLENNILKNCYFTSPFKIIAPFIKDDGFINLMIMSSSAGIMEGDTQSINIDIAEHCKVEVTAQSYEKIHKMKDGVASRDTLITVGTNSTLIYSPKPTIPFSLSSFISSTKIYLKDNTSKLIFAEMLTSGRVHYNENFNYNIYKAQTEIYVADEIVYIDNTCFEPKKIDMNGFLFYEGYTHLLNVILIHYDSNILINKIRKYLANIEEIIFGASQTYYSALVIKVLARNAQIIEKIFTDIQNLN
ncbi:hypothetical protein AN641_01145 [Candidatus Epulonipiscioides gigas]|nr:hypothetical protein AN641_01145 [Epulopiscium sp. SCG-C07WGA-EpuloA2]